MKRWLEARWYSTAPPPAALLPLARLYGRIADARAAAHKAQAVKLPVPVIVVGNISVGGTGKTPLVLWLIEQLRALGKRPGVVSRGYGGRATRYPLRVTPATDPDQAGDEPALIARRAQVPVAVAPDRVAAARLLIERGEVDMILADDGLQHYRLARDFEICVVDGSRGLGNGARLPAGPLREATSRLASVDLVVVNGDRWADVPVGAVTMQLAATRAVCLADTHSRSLAEFAGQRVHAVAGIGNPARFFATLRAAGIAPVEHAFADHHRYAEIDLAFEPGTPVLMTEKDAVKCAAFTDRPLWQVPVDAQFAPADAMRVRESLQRLF